MPSAVLMLDLTNFYEHFIIISGSTSTPKRAKDDPHGLAPIRVTEAEIKPSIKSSSSFTELARFALP